MISIKQIEIEDLDELSVLLEELSGLKTNKDKLTTNFKWMKDNKGYILLGAKYNNELVGSVMAIICRDLVGDCKPFMVIENVVVKSIMRGKALMIEVEKLGSERDCYYTMFVSSIQRKDAHRFYESMGYSLESVQGFKKYL